MKPVTPGLPGIDLSQIPAKSGADVCPEPGFDDAALKWKFAIEIDAVYTSGNAYAEDFRAGVQAGLDYLADKVGSNYSKNCVFAGFDLMIVSELWHDQPPSRPPIAVQFDTKSIGETSGPDIVKLYPNVGTSPQPNPWAQVPEGDRNVATPNLQAQELYAIFIVAYIRPLRISFLLGQLFWRTWIHRFSSESLDLSFTREWDEDEIKDFKWTTPFPPSYSRTVTHTEGRASATRTLNFNVSNNGYSCLLSTRAHAEKEDSRKWFINEWFVNLRYRVVTWHSLLFIVKIENSKGREVTVRLDYTQSLNEPPDLGPPIGHDPREDYELSVATTDLWNLFSEVDDPASLADLYKENVIGIYRRYDTSGFKEFKFRHKEIIMYVFWSPAHLDLYKAWLHRLKYSAGSEATLKVTVARSQ